MKHNIIAAAILAIGLIVAAFLFTGRYHLVRLSPEKMARMDRWTGSVKVYDCSGNWWAECDDAVSVGRANATNGGGTPDVINAGDVVVSNSN